MRKKRTEEAASPIEELHPATLLEKCKTSRLARIIVLCDEAGSTNEVAMVAASHGAPEGLLVVAEVQTSGRGRKGRRWLSTSGKSLTFSLLLKPARKEGGLTAIFALAVVNALSEFVGNLAIKWPNDIFCNGKKLGGILAESSGEAVVIGLGLNINESVEDFPPEIAGEAVSMRIAANKRYDRAFLLCRILEAFEELYERSEKEGFASLRKDIEKKLLAIGARVAIESGGNTFEGNMIGITNEGYLCLDIDGDRRIFSAGDLTLREKPPGA